MLAHVPSFERNPRGSPDFLAYPVPKACMHVLGTRVPRCLGVARSASTPRAAQALGCSLTPGLRISFGRVTCMARAASVAGLWTLGFLLLRGACVLVWVVVKFGFRLRPASPGWGVGVCVCFGPVLLAPRHSWLGCAAWMCVFGLGFPLRPATPGSGGGVCVCWCACSPCTPPLLAGVCGVVVCVWAGVSATPRHSWLGCWGVRVCVRAPPVPRHSWLWCAAWVCVFLLGFPLRPATPGWGVGVCVCSCARSACTPPLLAWVRGVGVGVWARVTAAPRHSWLGCAAWVCVFGLGFRLRPVTPGWDVGVCVCSCARSACTPPLLAGLCGVGVCVWARVSAAPRHSWLGCWGVCVLLCALRLCPASPGWVVRCGCGCLGSGFGCAPPLLAAVWGVDVCVWARVSAAPRGSWLGCGCVCVLLCALRLYPATPGWVVRRGCVCLGSGFGCAPSLLAGLLGCVCAPVHAPLVTRHSWLGCAVWVLVFGLGFRLRPATPGWGVRRGCVCLRSGFGCAPPLLAGLLGCVCAGVPALLVPRHSWLGCAVWVWVFELGFRLRPAIPGWQVGVCVFVCVVPPLPATPDLGVRRGCVCLGSGFGCATACLAGMLGCVCAGVRAPLVHRHSWLGRVVWVCVFGLGLWLRPATPGWGVVVYMFVCVLLLFPDTPGSGVRHGCVCLGSGFGPAPPCLAGLLGCVGAGVRAPLVLATPGWGAQRGCVCLGSGLGCAPPLLAGVLGCACWCACSPCTPPLLAGVCGVGCGLGGPRAT